MDRKPYNTYKIERLRRRYVKAIVWAFVAVALAAAVVAGASYLWLSCESRDEQTDEPPVTSTAGSTVSTAIGVPATKDILVIGVDRQPDRQDEPIRADSLTLMHADPEQDYLSLLSLPRDLQVEFAGQGKQKVSWVYSAGGADAVVQAVVQLTGVGVTDYLEIDLQAFRDLIGVIGGVYIDVDRHYVQTDPDFELMDLAPGYRLLEGEDALDYVRFRFDLNAEAGRMERQQRFFAALWEQAAGWDLAVKLPGFAGALFDNARTSLSADGLIQLAYWAATGLAGDRIRQATVPGGAQTIDGVSYFVPADGALQKAVQDHLAPPSAPASTTTVATEPTTTTEPVTTTEAGTEGTDGETDSTDGETDSTEPGADADPTTSTSAEAAPGQSLDPDEIPDSEMWRELAAATPFQLVGPGYLPEDYGYVDRYPTEAGAYDIVVENEVEKALKIVYQLTKDGKPADQYLGVTETTWLDAPAASPGRTVEVGGAIYTVVGTGERVERVWWKKDGVLYWVSNTLSYMMDADELLRVAQSMVEMPRGATR